MNRAFPQWLFYVTAGPLFRFFLRAEVFCPQSLASRVTRPLILAANHRSRLDPFLVALLPLSVVRKLVPISFPTTQREYRKWWQKPFIAMLGAYELPKLALSIEDYLAPTAATLANRGVVLMFPEGRIMTDERERRVRPGISLLARRQNAMVLPIFLHGTSAVGWKTILQRRAVVKVYVGEPLRVSEDLTNEQAAQEILERIEGLPKADEGPSPGASRHPLPQAGEGTASGVARNPK